MDLREYLEFQFKICIMFVKIYHNIIYSLLTPTIDSIMKIYFESFKKIYLLN